MKAAATIVFLYTEMAGYFLACIAELAGRGHKVHVVHWPVNPEAPFNFDAVDGAEFYDRSGLSDDALRNLIEEIKPNVLLCSGWIDKAYVKICRSHNGRVPTVLTADNHWVGSLRQQVARVVSPFTLHKTFSHAWVPGKPQVDYVGKLGFKGDKVQTGFYCADCNLFEQQYAANQQIKTATFPRRFIYIGRYLEFKGIFDLWQAFIKLRQEAADWELWCFGTGDLWDNRVEAEGIVHHGFVQPDALPGFLAQSGVFVLPSHKEPWGVVVHEMAAAGFPMICSNQIGAANTFLEEGKNGWTFEAGNVTALHAAMKKITDLSNEQLAQMAEHSSQLAKQITPKHWANTVESYLSES